MTGDNYFFKRSPLTDSALDDVMLAEIYMLRLELAIRASDATHNAANDQHISRAPHFALKAEEQIWASWIARLTNLEELSTWCLSYRNARRPSSEF